MRLADHTTIGLGGPPRRFVRAVTEPDLIEAGRAADDRGEPLLILGGGSNLVVADQGFDGTVVQVATKGIHRNPGDGLVTVAAGAGVINHYAGGGPISRTAAVIAPGAVVMAMIYAWGPLSGLHINPAVTFAFFGRRVFPAQWVLPYWVAQFAGAICAAVFLQAMFGDVSAGSNYPIARPGG